MSNARFSDELHRLLPGEQYKRIRAAILLARNNSTGFARSIRNQIDQDNRPRNGLLNAGTLDITSATTAELDEYAWVIEFEIFQPGFTEVAIEAPHPDVTRPDVFLGYFEEVGGENVAKIIYVPGIVDDEGNSLFPNIPDGHILLATVNRNPDGSNDVDPGAPDLSDFISKSATSEQSIESDFRVKKQASQEGIPLPAVFDVNGRVRSWRKDRLNVYNSVGVNNQWNQICQVTKSVSGQVRFSFLYMATNSADEIVYVECFCYVNINSSGNLVGYSFNYDGQLQNAEIKAVDAAENVGIFIRTNRSQNRHWVPIIANVASRITYNHLPPDLEALPDGDQYEFEELKVGLELDEDIVDGLEAADSPSGSNPFATIADLIPGEAGENAWNPIIANLVDGERVVQQVLDWFGGSGPKPTTGLYIGSTGYVTDIAEATNIRGAEGPSGGSGGGINLTEKTIISTVGRLDNLETPTDVLIITASTDITGFLPTISEFLRVIVSNGTFCTFRGNSTFSSANNRIIGLNGNGRVLSGYYIDFMYDKNQNRWVMQGFQIIKAGGQAGTTGSNTFAGGANSTTAPIIEFINLQGLSRFEFRGNGMMISSNMPTTNPLIAGALWNDGGIVKISAG
ncbi:hypothetical protein [Mongoliibacter ruber]|uniref:Uncharacterized protein n=1 Tax=Mongoliibacter ruber TaxID=1750599 RepID=A0A2T0WV38_9BACT|nr:hypothetical protein [Mongoliibacter ruber]PRY90555.1 hypothetical protein CLW00_101217 [Mongoliibacter ruber]